MMKVCYSEMDTPAGLSCRLEAAGHAGYAPAGQVPPADWKLRDMRAMPPPGRTSCVREQAL